MLRNNAGLGGDDMANRAKAGESERGESKLSAEKSRTGGVEHRIGKSQNSHQARLLLENREVGGAEVVRDTARSTATQRSDGDGRLAMNSKANQHLRGKNRQRKPRESALVCRGSYYIRVNVRVCALSPSGNTAAVAPSMATGQCK